MTLTDHNQYGLNGLYPSGIHINFLGQLIDWQVIIWTSIVPMTLKYAASVSNCKRICQILSSNLYKCIYIISASYTLSAISLRFCKWLPLDILLTTPLNSYLKASLYFINYNWQFIPCDIFSTIDSITSIYNVYQNKTNIAL